jgi:hypothetical protein
MGSPSPGDASHVGAKAWALDPSVAVEEKWTHA